MTTLQLKDGACSHNHSERMVALAKKWLLEYFGDGVARKPGEMEDDFAGQWSLGLEPWRQTPFFPALALLIDEGAMTYEQDDAGDFWYALPGHLPSSANADVVAPPPQRLPSKKDVPGG